MSLRKLLLLLPLVFLLSACRDSETVKRKYIEAGDKYAKDGKLKEASLMYRSALKRDARFGEAHLRLGDVELRRGEVGEAVRSYRRAFELLPNDPTPGAKLGDIYLLAFSGSTRDDRLLNEIKDLSATLLKRDPISFDGLRFKGFLNAIEGRFKDAAEDFEKARNTKGGDRPELLYALAQAYTGDDRWAEGEKLARETIGRFKSYAPMYDFLFGQYLKRQRPADAEAILKLKSENNPGNAYFRMQIASYYWATQRRADAEKIFQAMIGDPKGFPDAKRDVADFYFRVGDVDRAETLYRQMLAERPERKNEIRMRLLLVNVARNKPADALVLAEEIIKDDPQNFDALSARASLMLQDRDEKKTKMALADLQALVARDPKNAVVHFNLGRAYQQQNPPQLDAARLQFAEAVKLRPNFLNARLSLGRLLAAKGDYGKALSECDEMLKLSPNNLAARLLKSQVLLLTGGAKQARALIDETKKLDPAIAQIPDVKFIEAGLGFVEKKYPETERLLLDLRKLAPADTRPIIALAEVYVLTNRSDQAVQLLEKETGNTSNTRPVRLALANISARIGRLETAEKAYRDLLKDDSKNPLLYQQLAEVQRMRGDTAGSLETIRQGQAVAPADAGASLQLAMTLEAQGKAAEARPFYEQVLKVQPDNVVALNNLAFMMAEEGRDLDQALTMAQKARQNYGKTDSLSDEISDTLGWIYIKKSLGDNAIRIYQDLTKRRPDRAEFFYRLGMAQYQKGDRIAARTSTQTALGLLAKKANKPLEDKVRSLLAKL